MENLLSNLGQDLFLERHEQESEIYQRLRYPVRIEPGPVINEKPKIVGDVIEVAQEAIRLKEINSGYDCIR